MYLRTTRRKNKDGSVVTYYHLAHNYWDSESKQSVVRVIHNFGRADEVDREDLVRLCEQLKAELVRHPNQTATAGWAIDLLASPRTKPYLTVVDGQIQLDNPAIQRVPRTGGKWVIQTNDDTLTPEDAAVAYKSLGVIERCFRTLKTTQLKLSPVYHRLPRRIEAHVKICVTALLIERVIELRCGKPWSHIRRVLSTLQASEFHASSHLFFQRNQPSKQLKSLLKKLEIPLPDSVLGITPQKLSNQNSWVNAIFNPSPQTYATTGLTTGCVSSRRKPKL